MALIDLHSHVLPGIDDGASNMEEALALAEAAAGTGVRVLAGTPHLRADHPQVRPAELAGRCDRLNARLHEVGIPVEVVQAGEVDLDWAMSASADELRLVSYGGRGTDLLVETPYGSLPSDFEQRLGKLRLGGFRVLLAHPERNPALQRDIARVGQLVEQGVLVQLTARSLVSDGTAAHELAAALLTRGLAHVLASDAHAASGPAPPDLDSGVTAASAIAGARARWMALGAPAAILAGEPLPSPPAAGAAA